MIDFSFDNISSSNYGLMVKTIQPPTPPKPRYTFVQVLGKDGSYKFLDGYEDIDIALDVLIRGDMEQRRERVRQIGIWLSGEKELVLGYDTSITYLAVLISAEPMTFALNSEVLRLTFRGSIML